MKQTLFIALFCLTAAGGLFAQKVGDTLYVNVSSAKLKSSTGFFASTAGTVKYGDDVRVLAINGKWTQVRTSTNITGWIAGASLTAKRIAAQSNAANASAREIALAGKGFSPEVESEYKKRGEEVNYAAIDAMEKGDIPEKDLLAFIEEGRLAKGE
jgi:uncharacterized protein YgiM (DUF1202 family)